MFENLTDKLTAVFDNLRRRGKLSEEDVEKAMREVRLALLEADVNYAVVKAFTNRVKERSIGAEVSKALNPAQQVIKIVNEELIKTLGQPAPLNLRGEKPHVVMLVGLQGSGKTTAAAKLAKQLRARGERVMLVAADIYRPAAIKQLQTLGERIDVPVHSVDGAKPVQIAKSALDVARKGGFSVVILDTAGRSQLDDELMNELKDLNEAVPVKEILLGGFNDRAGSAEYSQGFCCRDSCKWIDLHQDRWRCPRRRSHLHPRGDWYPDQIPGHWRGLGCAGGVRPYSDLIEDPGDGRHARPDRESRSSLLRTDGHERS